MLLLVECLLLAEARVVDGGKVAGSLALSSIIHQSLHGLFALEPCWLHLVEWSVHDLLVHRLELAELCQVNLDVGLLAHKLSNQSDDIHQSCVEGILLDACTLCHSSIHRPDRWVKHHSRLGFKLSHRSAIFEPILFEEALTKLDVDDLLVLPQRLEADSTEAVDSNGSVDLNLLIAPSKIN